MCVHLIYIAYAKRPHPVICNHSFIRNSIIRNTFVIRQTSKTRGHILNSSTGILILNRVVVIYQPLLSKKYVYKQILPFVTHGLTSLFPVYSLVMKIILLHDSWYL